MANDSSNCSSDFPLSARANMFLVLTFLLIEIVGQCMEVTMTLSYVVVVNHCLYRVFEA